MGNPEFVVEHTRVDHDARVGGSGGSGPVAASTGHHRVLADATGSPSSSTSDDGARPPRLFMPMIDRLTRNDLQGGFDRLTWILERSIG